MFLHFLIWIGGESQDTGPEYSSRHSRCNPGFGSKPPAARAFRHAAVQHGEILHETKMRLRARAVTEAMKHAFVAMSRFAVANDKIGQVKQAFRDRPRLVEGASGFLRMDVISPEESPEEIWLITYWTDRPSYLAWHGSPAHSDSHKYIPKGLKLDPKRTSLTYFEYVSG